jgi:glycosyltransferase involved in cell wall biosynthesis
MINVVLFTSTFDTGGQGWRIKRAFERYQPDFSVRSIHTTEAYFGYPHDVLYSAGPDNAYKLTEAADIIHFRNHFGGLKRLRASGRPVGLVLHHHGTKFRAEHDVLAAEARQKGAIQLVSTLDLAVLEPDLEWLPSPFDVSELANMRLAAEAARTGGPLSPIRIAHSPTNRTVKSTNLVLEAVQKLVDSGFSVVLDLIERKSYAETLFRKAKADILVDQLHLGYGNSAIEAWGMGIPVIAGVSEPKVREAMLGTWGSLPFYETTPVDLANRLAELITDSGLRSHWGEIGRNHALTYHEEQKVSELLANHYRSALASIETKRTA